MEGGGGLEALLTPFPKLPRVPFVGGGGSAALPSPPLLQKEMGRGAGAYFSVSPPTPQLSPRCSSGGGLEDRWEGRCCRSVANTKCHFLLVI